MKDKNILYLFILYFFANGFMLINQGAYWDDWTILDMDRMGLWSQFGENGFWILVYFNDMLNDGKYAPMLYHWISFIFMFLAYGFLFKILKQFRFQEKTAFVITLMAMLIPYFEAKNTMICTPYSMFLFLFSLGLYLTFSFIENNGKELKFFVIGTVCLFFSFFLNSLIPLFLVALVLFFISKNEYSIKKIKTNNRQTILAYAGLLVLPFIFWGIKKKLFPIQGVYASSGYNKIDFSLEELPELYEKIIEDNITGMYYEFLNIFEKEYSFAIITLIFCFVVSTIILFKIPFKVTSIKKLPVYLIIGLLLFFVAAFPYVVVHKFPGYTGFYTRHQILLPIGVSFFCYAIISFFPFEILRKVLYILLLSIFMTTTINANFNFLRGWMKLEAVKIDVKKAKVKNGGYLRTRGFKGQFNATERPYLYYELAGIFKQNLHRQDLFITDKWISPEQREYVVAPKGYPRALLLNMRDVDSTEEICNKNNDRTLEIVYNEEKLNHFKVLKWVYYYYLNADKFITKADKFITVTYGKYDF